MDSVISHTPIVSVVMAAHNEEKYIAEAIESVLNQTFRDFEFIIVNDGSVDMTEQIILSYKDTRIKYIKNEENIKLIASLNKGLKAATGKYIARMDADDICKLHRLETQVKFMDQHLDIGISGAQLEIFGSDNGLMTYPLTHEEIQFRLFITSCFGNNVVIFRRELMEKHNLYFPQGYLHAEDYKCWTNWIKVSKLANLNEVLVKYRSHSGSVSAKNRILQRETRDRIRQEYLIDVFKLQNETDIARDFFGNISRERVEATKLIFEKNRREKVFPSDVFEKYTYDLWYSDCLEKTESRFLTIFKFPLIVKLDIKMDYAKWLNLFKHYLKVNIIK